MKKELQQIESLLQKLKNSKTETVEMEIKQPELPFKIGEKYFIRTVTHYYTGYLLDIVGKFIILDDCCWIADTGRFMQAVKGGDFNEIEPMGNSVIVNSDSIIDAVIANFQLPNSQK
jgi:hypothetical protein